MILKGIRKAVLGAAMVLSLTSAPVNALPRCADHTTMMEALWKELRQVMVASGLDVAGNLVQLMAAEDGRTWSIVVTGAGGPACVVAQGGDWQSMSYVGPGEKA